MARGHRFPRFVYDAGEEPDVQLTLANERTFLAWIRTALALLAAGVAVAALDLPLSQATKTAAALVLIGAGALSPVQAFVGWMRTERALRRREPLPSPALSLPVAIGVVVVGVIVAVGLVVP